VFTLFSEAFAQDNSQKIRSILSKRTQSVQGYNINTLLLKGIYNSYNFEPIWHGENEVFNDQGRKVIEFLSKAEESGLDPAEYSINLINKRLQESNSKKLPYTDILITQMFVNILSDISNGKKIEKEWEIETFLKRKPRIVNYYQAISNFLNSDDVEAFIKKNSPNHQGYHNLRVALKKLLAERESSKKLKKIPEGKSIYPGTMDYRISKIRERLGSKIAPSINPSATSKKNFYDKPLQKDILNLQKRFGLKTDGIIGRQTIEALNTGNEKIIGKIKANMERYRWFSNTFEEDRVVVNVPEFRLRAYEAGEEKLSLTVIVGRRNKKTPIIEATMTDVVFHPYWYAPQEYGATQILPLIQQNPENYIIDEEYSVIDNSNGGWKILDPSTIDWPNETSETFKYILRQDPGKKNALGPIKFNITNDLSIYLHGTTSPWLFSNRVRSFSSGCIRIDGPQKLAYFVMKHNPDFNKEEIDELLSAYENDYNMKYDKKPRHRKVDLAKRIPTYLTYFTVVADEEGNYHFFDDIYGWDKLI